MKVFLDIGAHDGETLQVVTDPRWGFDRIYSFEPAPLCWPKLEALATVATVVCRFGLWDKDATVPLFNPGYVGASVSVDKDVEVGTASVECEFRDAAEWFKHNLSPNDEVWAKINVEGAEAELVQRLAETGTLALVDHLLIHFDVRKVPSKQHLEPVIREQLDAAGVDYVPAHEIQFGGVYRGTRNWLAWASSTSPMRGFRYKTMRRASHGMRARLYPLKKALAQRN
jgi:FkbM family methyltransferase